MGLTPDCRVSQAGPLWVRHPPLVPWVPEAGQLPGLMFSRMELAPLARPRRERPGMQLPLREAQSFPLAWMAPQKVSKAETDTDKGE